MRAGPGYGHTPAGDAAVSRVRDLMVELIGDGPGAQAAAARRAGMTAPAVQSWVSGDRVPRLRGLAELADAFGWRLSLTLVPKVTPSADGLSAGDVAAALFRAGEGTPEVAA